MMAAFIFVVSVVIFLKELLAAVTGDKKGK